MKHREWRTKFLTSVFNSKAAIRAYLRKTFFTNFGDCSNGNHLTAKGYHNLKFSTCRNLEKVTK